MREEKSAQQTGTFREISRNAKYDFAKNISRKMGAKNCENEHGRFRHISGLNYVQKRTNIRRFETQKCTNLLVINFKKALIND